MKTPQNVTRYIKREVERELWGRAAARCEFSDCNKILYKSPVTQESVNLAEKAHVYSFSADGPRGWGPFASNPAALNSVQNLMLVCGDCHKLIDEDKKGTKYSAGLLQEWKSNHEARVRAATGISSSKRSHVVLYGARIGDEHSPLNMHAAFDGMFPDRFPADDRAINLSMQSGLDDATPQFWVAQAAHLRKEFVRQLRPRIEEGQPNHFSIFALAPQPLLIQLGALLTDKVPAVTYQPVREPKTWRRQPHPTGFRFIVNKPSDLSGTPAILFSLSANVAHDRIRNTLGTSASIWELTSNDCHNDFLRSEEQLSMFRETVRKLLAEVTASHPHAREIAIFPVMPVACAVELGRVRQPKADLPWTVYDEHKKCGGFVERLRIGATDE